tara:strand:- start:27 stop:452 length:426 start_codon:yes stop_codon:yes gene_type:complete
MAFKKGRKVRKPLSSKKRQSKSTDQNLKLSLKKDTSDSGPKFRKRNNKDPDLSGYKKLFKDDKVLKGYDDKVFKSITGDTVGTEKAFQKAGLEVPDYDYTNLSDSIDDYLKKGGSIKKGMKKVKARRRAALRGQRKELRGS